MATLMNGGALGDDLSDVEATQDALFGGGVVLFQPPRGRGYRTNVDALLLAGFATARKVAEVAFDLGAGVGAVGLALLRLGAARRVVFVEIDGVPAAMARRNLDANGWTDRGEVLRGDVRDVARARWWCAILLTSCRVAGGWRPRKRARAAARWASSSRPRGRSRAEERGCASSTRRTS